VNSVARERVRAQEPWRARLELQFEAAGARTVLARRRHEGPLLVQRPFYPEGPLGGPCHTYVIHPPGGVVSGDELELSTRIAPGARVLMTTAAAGKFYRSADAQRASRVIQQFQIEHGELEWLPFESIFYPSSVVELSTRVHFTAQSRFIGWEIGCLGLPARGQGLEDGRVRQSIELWREQRPLVLERLQLDAVCASARWGLDRQPAFGSCFAYPAGASELELARAAAARGASSELTIGCSLLEGVLTCRARALHTDRLRAAFIELWRALRPLLLGRAALLPRIWAT
jgi:urease accessory protein